MVVSHWSSREMASYSFTWDTQGAGGRVSEWPVPQLALVLIPSLSPVPESLVPKFSMCVPACLPERSKRRGFPLRLPWEEEKMSQHKNAPASLFYGWETGLEV